MTDDEELKLLLDWLDRLAVQWNREGLEGSADTAKDVVAQIRRLQLNNKKLKAALKPIADIPIEDFGLESKPEHPLMAWNSKYLYVKDVLTARNVSRD